MGTIALHALWGQWYDDTIAQYKSSTFMNEMLASGHTWLVQLCPFTRCLYIVCIINGRRPIGTMAIHLQWGESAIVLRGQ